MSPEKIVLLAATLLFILLAGFSFWRGLLKLKRANELETDPRLRKIAFLVRYTGRALLLCALGCAGAAVSIWIRLL